MAAWDFELLSDRRLASPSDLKVKSPWAGPQKLIFWFQFTLMSEFSVLIFS